MKPREWLVALAAIVFATPLAAQDAEKKTPDESGAPQSLKEKASYGVGRNIGLDLLRSDWELDTAMLVRGLLDTLNQKKPPLGEEELRQALAEYQKEMAARLAEKVKAEAARNLKAGEEFLEAHEKRTGVKTTESGLQYEVLQEGSGPSPSPTDVVRVHYHGTLIDGRVFDSSVKRGKPSQFRLNEVIKGWTEAVQMMKVGGKWKIVLPPNLAYGPRPPRGSIIGPNSVLIFEIELLGIVQPAKKKSP